MKYPEVISVDCWKLGGKCLKIQFLFGKYFPVNNACSMNEGQMFFLIPKKHAAAFEKVILGLRYVLSLFATSY